MRQLFAPGADAIFRFAILTAVSFVVVATLMTILVARSDWWTQVGVAPPQPAPFSHKHHAGELGIDCRYCHTEVETQATAGIPPTYTCMTCHSQIWTTSAMLAPIRESLAQNKPLHWTRVEQLPSYVYFNHSIHIAKGIGCSSCHGAMTTMQLSYKAKSFQMDFCINCHSAPEQFLRPKKEIWDMEWHQPPNQATLAPRLAAEYHLMKDRSRLTDCSTCHR